MGNITKHLKGTWVVAEKNGVIIKGVITSVNPAMSYEITLQDGNIRSVDHCHIDTTLFLGDKVRWKEDKNVCNELKDNVFCLLGSCNNAVALIKWENRGGYNFDYYICFPPDDLVKCD